MITRSYVTKYFPPTATRGARIKIYDGTALYKEIGMTGYDYGARDAHEASLRAVLFTDNIYTELEESSDDGNVRRYLAVTKGY